MQMQSSLVVPPKRKLFRPSFLSTCDTFESPITSLGYSLTFALYFVLCYVTSLESHIIKPHCKRLLLSWLNCTLIRVGPFLRISPFSSGFGIHLINEAGAMANMDGIGRIHSPFQTTLKRVSD